MIKRTHPYLIDTTPDQNGRWYVNPNEFEIKPSHTLAQDNQYYEQYIRPTITEREKLKQKLMSA